MLGLGVFAFLAVYSVAILVTEWRTSQDHIRNYLDDISGDVTFYLVNTSLSVFLLGATALMFVVTLRCTPTDERTFRWFLWSQAAVFAFLALDDRFQVHEKTAAKLGDVPDHFVLLVVAAAEVVFLVLWAPRSLLREPPGRWFVAGGIGFVVMLGIDALAPEDGRLRLSFEDLTKTWAAWLLFLSAWTLFERQLDRLRGDPGAEPSTDGNASPVDASDRS